MTETPSRVFTAASISQEDSETIAQLAQSLDQNSFAYDSHVQLINLLHNGFVAHVDAGQIPTSFELLKELRQAREAMDYCFSLGEDLLCDWITDETLLATTMEDRIAVMELCRKAIEDEPQSARLWRLRGDWMYRLWSASSGYDAEARQGWSAEDEMLGREVFTWDLMKQVWEDGVTATQWRLSDSNLVWDRYIEILIETQVGKPVKGR